MFNAMRLKEVVHLASDAYCGTTDYSSNHELIIRGNAKALFIRRDNEVVVSIAGTNDVLDLVHAVRVCNKQDYKNTKTLIHRGFYQHSLKLKRAILNRLLPSDKYVCLIGHSLGGVAAQITSLFLPGKIKIDVFAIGAPKAFKHPFQLPRNVIWFDVEADYDIIPNYPLSNFKYKRGVMNDINHLRYYQIYLTKGKRQPVGLATKLAKIIFTQRGYWDFAKALYQYHSLSNYFSYFYEQEND